MGGASQAVVIYGLLAAWWAGSSSRTWEKTVAWTLAALFIVGTVLARIRLGAVLWAEKGFSGREA